LIIELAGGRVAQAGQCGAHVLRVRCWAGILLKVAPQVRYPDIGASVSAASREWDDMIDGRGQCTECVNPGIDRAFFVLAYAADPSVAITDLGGLRGRLIPSDSCVS